MYQFDMYMYMCYTRGLQKKKKMKKLKEKHA